MKKEKTTRQRRPRSTVLRDDGLSYEKKALPGVIDGDTVATKGKHGKETMATMAMILDADVTALNASVIVLAEEGTLYLGAIGMVHDAMKKVGVRSGDRVTVHPAPDVAFGRRSRVTSISAIPNPPRHPPHLPSRAVAEARHHKWDPASQMYPSL